MNSSRAFIVQEEHSNRRLDIFLTEKTKIPRSEIQRLIRQASVRVDGNVSTRVSAKVDTGQLVELDSHPSKQVIGITESPEWLNVVYEDQYLAVINKPAGMTVHPGPGHPADTLVNAAVSRWPDLASVGEPERPGIVHRLDRDTSGLLIIALCTEAYLKLSKMIREHEVTRSYTALVHGHMEQVSGVVDAPVGRSRYRRIRQAVVEEGRTARTLYQVLTEFENHSLLTIKLETGRTHQIRVHMDAIGHSVVGDQTYGPKSSSVKLTRQFLHASKLEFRHPVTDEPVSVASDLPEDLQNELDALVER